jgi:hypothetical protein
MAAIAAQQRPQLGHGHWRSVGIPDQLLGQVSQMQNCLALQIISRKARHPAPAYPQDITQQAVTVAGILQTNG